MSAGGGAARENHKAKGKSEKEYVQKSLLKKPGITVLHYGEMKKVPNRSTVPSKVLSSPWRQFSDFYEVKKYFA